MFFQHDVFRRDAGDPRNSRWVVSVGKEENNSLYIYDDINYVFWLFFYPLPIQFKFALKSFFLSFLKNQDINSSVHLTIPNSLVILWSVTPARRTSHLNNVQKYYCSPLSHTLCLSWRKGNRHHGPSCRPSSNTCQSLFPVAPRLPHEKGGEIGKTSHNNNSMRCGQTTRILSHRIRMVETL